MLDSDSWILDSIFHLEGRRQKAFVRLRHRIDRHDTFTLNRAVFSLWHRFLNDLTINH